MENNLNVKFSPGKLFHSLIFFTVLFPFIPGIVPTTDTQPTFSMIFMVSLVYVLVFPRFQYLYYHLSYRKILFLFCLMGLILLSVVASKIFIGLPTLWARIFSFVQFALAVFFAYSTTYFIREERLKTTIIIFSIFSIIFFISHGLVERILIPSRVATFDALQSTGRGASTLSPEPSFFALHILNLYIIYCLVATVAFKKKHGSLIFWLASFCLMITLSGYGFVIFLILLILRFTKISFILFAFLLAMSGFILQYLESFQGFRGFKLLATVLANDPAILLKDASFATRFSSFFNYLANIRDNILLGDGFTLLQGGGFISIVSSLGILAAVFLIFVLFQIFFLKKSNAKIKLLLVFWFLINLFSGPIGIPTLGVIIGLMIRRNHASESSQLALNERRTA